MSDNNKSLRKPVSIDSLNELEAAKRKAQINATQDRLLLTNNLADLRKDAPQLLLKQLVLPVVGVGAAVWGVSKLVGSLTKPDTRTYYVEPQDEYEEAPARLAVKDARGKRRPVRLRETPPSGATGSRGRSALSYTKYIPVAVQLAKMGVSYLEKQGKPIPQVVHDLLSGPGVSHRQKAKPAARQDL